MNAYPKYKPIEYKWLGEIPEHWGWLFLSQACRSQEIKNTGNAENNVLSLSYGRIIRKKDINFGLVPKNYKDYQIVDNGNIILRLTDLQNDKRSLRTGLVRERGIITSAYTCLVPFQNAEYLQLLLHAYDVQKYFYGLGGGVRQSIGFKEIKYTMIPLPPREEQDHIVRWLNWQTSRIAHYIRGKKREIECLRELKKAIINESVAKGDEGWATKALRHLLQRVTVKNRPEMTLLSVVRERGVIPRKLDKSENHNVIPGDLSGNLLLLNGQFVINKMKAWQGSCAVSELNGIVSPAYFVFDLSFENKKFFHYAIRSGYYTAKFAQASKGIRSGQWDLPVQEINRIEFMYPPPDEQDCIVAYLDEQCAAIDAVIAKLTWEIELVGEFRASMISDAVTGKVDLRDAEIPDFEPTDELINDDEEGTENDDD